MESLKSTNNQTTSAASQQFVDVAEIKDGVVVLKNGSLRAILAVSAINFDLKSFDEQDAIVAQYQNFLNSLDFPVQILTSSRKLNVDEYISFIERKEKQQSNELLKLQIAEYKHFIRQLVSVANIMDKNFYIIVPFSPIENEEKGFFSNLFSSLNTKRGILEKRKNFEAYKNQLYQRVDHISAALSGIGVRIALLNTQALIELIYKSYNPNIFMDSKLGDVREMELK